MQPFFCASSRTRTQGDVILVHESTDITESTKVRLPLKKRTAVDFRACECSSKPLRGSSVIDVQHWLSPTLFLQSSLPLAIL